MRPPDLKRRPPCQAATRSSTGWEPIGKIVNRVIVVADLARRVQTKTPPALPVGRHAPKWRKR